MSTQVHPGDNDEMRPEYDFSQGVRGKHYQAYRAGTNVVFLEPDIAAAFPDSASVNQALTSIGREKPDFALLDLNLGNENSIPVATRLTELKVPFMFATGYGERAPIPAELAEAPVVQKPYTREVVEVALGRMREAILAKG